MDIAELGLRAESSSIAEASDRLGKLGKQAAAAESAAASATEKFDRQSAATKRGATASKKFEDQLKRQTTAMGNAGAASAKYENELRGIIAQAGRMVVAFAGFEAIRRLTVGAFSAAREYGKAIAEVGTLLKDTSGLQAQSLALRELAKSYGTDGTEQVRAYYQAVSAGAQAGAEALTLVAVANRTAIGSITDTATVVDILTTATNAYAASGLTAADASDTLFIGVAAGKTTMNELAGSMGRLIPTATAAGLSFDSMVAAVAALTLQGQDTRLAVTGMSAAIASVITPTTQAAEKARELGLQFDLAALQSKGFAGFLADVVDKSKGSKEALAILFGSMEASRAVFSLAGEGGVAFTKIMEQMGQRAGATEVAFSKMSKTVDFQMRKLGAAISDAMISAGESMTAAAGPAVEFLVRNFELLAKTGAALALVIGTVLVGRAGAALIVWLAQSVVGFAAQAGAAALSEIAMLKAAGASTAMAVATAGASASMGLLGGAMALAGGPIGLAVIAIGAIVLALNNASAAQREAIEKQQAGIASLEQYAEGLRAARVERELLSRAESAGNDVKVQTAVEDLANAERNLVAVKKQLIAAKAQLNIMDALSVSRVIALSRTQKDLTEIIERAKKAFTDLGGEIQKSGNALERLDALFPRLKNAAIVGQLIGMANAFRSAVAEANATADAAAAVTTAEGDLGKSLAGTIASMHAQLIEMTQGKQAALEWQAVQQTGVASTAKLSASIRAQIAEIARLDAAIGRSKNSKKDETAAAKALNAQLDREIKERRELMIATEGADASARGVIADIRAEADALLLTFEAQRRLNAAREIAAKADGRLSDKRLKQLLDEADAALDVVEAEEAAIRQRDELQNALDRLNGTRFDDLIAQVDRLHDALQIAIDSGAPTAEIAKIRDALGGAKQEALLFANDAIGAGLSSLKSMAKEGSKAYKAIEIAQAAVNLSTAIGAVANQGLGDPYTAFARMAAMAAAVSALIGKTIGFGGGGPSVSERRQDAQGTGTVLGDATAKSESILRAAEITADATSQLVGINRGMLNALTDLQDRIGAAGGLLARGAGNVEFSVVPTPELFGGLLGGLTKVFDGLTNTLEGLFGGLGKLFGSLFSGFGLLRGLIGGSSKVKDQGILLGGGGLSDINAQAFQTVSTRRSIFSRRRTREQTADLPDDASAQFQLIIDSIVDTVREGAIALGIVPAEVEAAIAAYQLEVTRISLKGLSAEEQQAELEAVFSSIFDGLAGSVVPFIEQFQQIGEGLGETLVRVATEVQVTQEAVNRLGFALDETDPEKFAQISDSLIEMAGGLDAFVEGMATFVDKFAPEAHKFELLQDDLTRAFDQVGLTIPDTREGMFALMQSLDATTESGREQIATLLRLASTADAYYTALETRATDLVSLLREADDGLAQGTGGIIDWTARMADLVAANDRMIARAIELGASEDELARVRAFAARRVDDLTAQEAEYVAGLEAIAAAQAQAATSLDQFIGELVNDGYSEPIQAIIKLNEQYRANVETIQQLARESGRAAASQNELLIATRWYQRQLRKLAGELMDSATALLAQLGFAGFVDQGTVNAAEQSGVADVTAAVEDRYARELQLLQQLDDFVRSLNLSAISPLTPSERVDAAAAEFQRILGLAQSGDLDALGQLPEVAQAYLEELASFTGGVGDFPAIFAQVQAALAGLVSAGPQSEQIGPQTPVFGGPVDVNPGDGFQSLNERERATLTQQLVDHLAALALALNVPILQLLDEMGVPLAQLAADLGADLQNLTGASVQVLADLAHDLGLPLGTLVESLGLSLPDIADGVRELAEGLGINLSELTTETALGLVALAGQLSTDLADLTTSLGIDLGALTDANSPIFTALQATIDELSPDIGVTLQPLLDNIANAATEADATQAVIDAETAINAMPAGIRDQLAPFFANVFPAGSLSDLDYLMTIDASMFSLSATASRSEGLLANILENMRAQNDAAGIPSYEQGTAFVPSTGLAMLHAGEMVIPREVSNRIAGGDLSLSASGAQPSDDPGYAELLVEVRALRSEMAGKLSAIADNTGVVATDVRTPKPQARGR